MNYFTIMYVTYCLTYSTKYGQNILLFYLFAFKFGIQISIFKQLEYDQNVIFMVKVLQDSDDIWMVYLAQYANILACFYFGSQFENTQLLSLFINQKLACAKLPVLKYYRILFQILNKLIFIHLLLLSIIIIDNHQLPKSM